VSSRYQLEEAARLLKPLRQGDLDGLCGLYAVINAIRLVVHPFRPLRRPELKALFNCGLTSLSAGRRLRRSITGGMTNRTWLRLCNDVVFEAAAITRLEMFATPLFDAGVVPSDYDAVRIIRHSLRDGWPVLVGLMDSYDHTSVIAGFSRTRLVLFDSSGNRWVGTRSVSFDPAKLGNPHHIPPQSVVAVLAF
jgi:hypothetical protein